MPMNVEGLEDELRNTEHFLTACPRNRRRKPLIVLLLMFGVFVGNYGTAEGTACFSDYDESRPLASNLKLVSRPQVTDGILHYCDDHQLCTITCINMDSNPLGVSSSLELDNKCITLAEIKNISDYVVLEEEPVNTTIQFPCPLVGSVRCVIDDEHFSAMVRIAKDEEENCGSQLPSQAPPTSSAQPSSTSTVSTGSTDPTASTGSTIKPNKPTNKDYSGVIAAIVVIVAVILLVVMITVIAAPCFCYKYKKFCWRELVQRKEIEIPGPPEPEGLAILSVSNSSSHTNIPDNTPGGDVGGVSETTECFTRERMPNLDQEQDVVSIDNQEQEVLVSPVQEEHPSLDVGRRNEVPDGTDEDAELFLPKPVQATN